MRKFKLFIGLAAVLALPALGSAPALAADACPPGTANPSYCPAPTVVTGPTIAITRTGATVSGSINPHGTSALYLFQYGTTASYTSVTTIGTLAATSSTAAVTGAIASLTPGTLYHYRLVAVNNGRQAGAGLDATFSTLAAAKIKTSLGSTKVKPKTDKKLPFKFKFTGSVKLPAGTSKAGACGGKVSIKLKKGSKTVASGTAKVSTKCTYKKTITIKNTKKTGKKKAKLKVTLKYAGDSKLKSSATKRTSVTIL